MRSVDIRSPKQTFGMAGTEAMAVVLVSSPDWIFSGTMSNFSKSWKGVRYRIHIPFRLILLTSKTPPFSPSHAQVCQVLRHVQTSGKGSNVESEVCRLCSKSAKGHEL